MMRTKMNEIYPIEWIQDEENNNTIFRTLSDGDSYPSVNDFINEDNCIMLDWDYYVGFSADKFISPLHQKTMDLISATTPKNQIITNLAIIIYNRFATKWKKIYDALMIEYNPLENYSMVEERTPDLTFEETENVNTEVTTNRETNATSKYKGFNASDPVTITSTDGTDDVTTSGLSADNETTKTTTNTGTETLTRSGNIGVTTSQQMLESEFKVRQYDFYKMIYNDIDSILCLSVY